MSLYYPQSTGRACPGRSSGRASRSISDRFFFAAGTLCEDLKREVNDRDFDVALHLVFKDKAAQDQYQTAPRHEQFIKENKGNWTKVRVFDSYVSR